MKRTVGMKNVDRYESDSRCLQWGVARVGAFNAVCKQMECTVRSRTTIHTQLTPDI